MEWEVRLIEWIQSNTEAAGLLLGKFFTFLGGEMGLVLTLVILTFCWRKEAGLRMVLIVSSGTAWLPMLKGIVLRPRPFMEHPERVRALALVDADAAPGNVAAQGYSFPSMHSASAASCYFALAGEAKKRWVYILAAFVTLMVGLSRVMVGAHYPTDVMAGWILGFVILGFHALLERYVSNSWIRHLIIIAIALPGIFFVRTHDYFTSLGLVIGAVAAIHFEEKYVHFADTRRILPMILRPLFALAIFFALNTLLKLPFDPGYLAGSDMGALLIRTVRYAILIFVILGIYPMVFPALEKLGTDPSAPGPSTGH